MLDRYTFLVGLDKLLPKVPSHGNAQIPTIPLAGAQAGPPVAGFPNLPGLPGLPGAIGPNGQVDFLNLFCKWLKAVKSLT